MSFDGRCLHCGSTTDSCANTRNRDECPLWLRYGPREDRQRAASSEQRSSFAPDERPFDAYGRLVIEPTAEMVEAAIRTAQFMRDNRIGVVYDPGFTHSSAYTVDRITGEKKPIDAMRVIADEWTPDGFGHYKYEMGRDGAAHAVFVKSPNAPPFSPEQEKRLRQIAWEACRASYQFDVIMRGGQPIEACRVRDAFLRGDA